MRFVPRLLFAVACAGFVSCAAAGFWLSQLLVDTAGGATPLPTLPSPVTIDPLTMTFAFPIGTIVMTVPGFPPSTPATTTAAAPTPAPVAPAPAAAPPEPAAVTPPTATTAPSAQAPAAAEPAARPAPRATTTTRAKPVARVARKPPPAEAPQDAENAQPAVPPTTALESSPPPVDTAQAPAPAPTTAAKPAAAPAAASVRPKTPEPAVAAKPTRPAAPPPAHVAAPSPPSVREGLSPVAAGGAPTPVAHADTLPWPLSAAAARPGGVGLLAAAAGLLAVGVVRRRTRVAAVAALETCEITISHTDGDAEFCAQAIGPRGKGYVAARSVLFRWNGDTLPDNAAVHAAHDVLVQRLAWDGWRREAGRDGSWWNASFSRPVGSAVDASDG